MDIEHNTLKMENNESFRVYFEDDLIIVILLQLITNIFYSIYCNSHVLICIFKF